MNLCVLYFHFNVAFCVCCLLKISLWILPAFDLYAFATVRQCQRHCLHVVCTYVRDVVSVISVEYIDGFSPKFCQCASDNKEIICWG